MSLKLLLREVDVVVVVPAVVRGQSLPVTLQLRLALDDVPLQALLRHLVLLVERADNLLIVVSSHLGGFCSLGLLNYKGGNPDPVDSLLIRAHINTTSLSLNCTSKLNQMVSRGFGVLGFWGMGKSIGKALVYSIS